MATAFKEKTRAEQFVNHTGTSANKHESTCTRCGGFMVNDSYLDLLNNVGESKVSTNRCVQCGEVVDPVILRNRAVSHEAMMDHLARILSI
jgi:hypothetical protein